MSRRELPKRAALVGPPCPVSCAATAELLTRYNCALQAWDGPNEDRLSRPLAEVVDGSAATTEPAASIRLVPVDFVEARNRFYQQIRGLTASADLDHIHSFMPTDTTAPVGTSRGR
ncbi:hypothetical protein [Nocardia xishanensis]|uniref:hypothetical protein n=1 Tax=Nocardia xishanensis TaxID=238964 RepID=UPI0008370F7A|nr:hypothetical protein [Nocardia xishanensis]